MFEQIFGSKIKLALTKLFLARPDKSYQLAELSQLLKKRPNYLRAELRDLEKVGLINSLTVRANPVISAQGNKVRLKPVKKYQIYQTNTNFVLYPELHSLFLKAQLLLEKSFLAKIKKLGNISLLILTGNFVNLPHLPTDILLVGRVNRQRLANLIKKFERALGTEINYTVMSVQEFKYRRDITDVFLYEILENKKVVLVDKL